MAITAKTNPISLAKGIISAHKKWESAGEQGSPISSISATLARQGRKNMADAVGVMKSAKGRLSAPGALNKSDDFLADCLVSVGCEDWRILAKAIDLIEYYNAKAKSAA